jgi:hypothetical protein
MESQGLVKTSSLAVKIMRAKMKAVKLTTIERPSFIPFLGIKRHAIPAISGKNRGYRRIWELIFTSSENLGYCNVG